MIDRMKILVTDPLAPEGLAVFNNAAGFEVDVKLGLKPAELKRICADYDGWVIRSGTRISAELIEAAKNLKVIGRAGVGHENIDADAATKVIAADVEIDKLNASLFAELIAHVATDPATVTRVIPLTSICRYLERAGDHVKNLAEEVVYMVRATDVRHRPLPQAHN